MKTKELVDWLNEVIKYYEKDTIPWKRIKEIIKRLEEHEEMRIIIANPHLTQDHTMRGLLNLVKSG